MFLALDENGSQVTAEDAVKNRKYFCPVCDAPVTFKSGNIKLPHFSHHRILNCIRYLYKKESVEHMQAKHDLYLKLRETGSVAMEYYLPAIEQIPDLLVDGRLALEVQFSTISADLIAERSRGYHSLGMEVIWLLDEESIRMESDRCMPTNFQLSTQYMRSLFTCNVKTKKIHRIMLHHNHGCGRWSYVKCELDAPGLLAIKTFHPQKMRQLTRREIKQMIQRERLQRSVLNPTLSFMYHLGLDDSRIPSHLCWTIEAERWILNPPLEWKLFLYLHIQRGTFHMDMFEQFIRMRTVQGAPAKKRVIEGLLYGYHMLFNSQ